MSSVLLKGKIDSPDSKSYAFVTKGGAILGRWRIGMQERRRLRRWACHSDARCVLRSLELLRFYCGSRVSLGNNARNRHVDFSKIMGLSPVSWRGKTEFNRTSLFELTLVSPRETFLKGELRAAYCALAIQRSIRVHIACFNNAFVNAE